MNSSNTQPETRRQELKTLLIGTLLWIFLILPIFLPLRLYRLLVHFLARQIHPDLIPLTNPVDNAFILGPTHNTNNLIGVNVVCVWKINGHLDTSQFRKHFYQTFLSSEKLRKTYGNYYCYFVEWMGYCFKKPVKSINLEEQIQERNWSLTDVKNLERFIVKWMNQNDFGNGNPAWKILIIHVDKSDNIKMDKNQCETILLYKIDHGLADGYTVTDFIDKLTGNQSPYIIEEESRSLRERIKTALAYPKMYFDLQQRWKASKDLLHISKSEILKEPNCHIALTTLDLHLLKKVRRATKAHFSVILGMLHIGALRRYLLKKGFIKSEEELPIETCMSATVGLPNHPIKLDRGIMANHFSLTEWSVPTSTNKSLKERISKAETAYLEILEGGMDRIFSDFAVPLFWSLPTKWRLFLTKLLVQWKTVPAANFSSCMILSSRPYQLLGNSVENIYGLMNITQVSPWIKTVFTSLTIGNKLNVAILATSDVCFSSQADLDWFTQVLLKEELDDLVASCDE